jgi:hypothetical protein
MHESQFEVIAELNEEEVKALRAFLAKKTRKGSQRVAASKMDKPLQILARIRADFMAASDLAEVAPNRAQALASLQEVRRTAEAVLKSQRPALRFRFLPLLKRGPERRLELAGRLEPFKTWAEGQAFRHAITPTDNPLLGACLDDALHRATKGASPTTWAALFERFLIELKGIAEHIRTDENFLRAVVCSVSGDTVEVRGLPAARRGGIPWSVLDEAIPLLHDTFAVPFSTAAGGDLAQIIGILAWRDAETVHAWLKAWKKRPEK